MLMYNVGEEITLRDDLVIGKEYRNLNNEAKDVFSYGMKDYAGKKGEIIGIQEGKYLLDLSFYHLFTEEMFENPSQ